MKPRLRSSSGVQPGPRWPGAEGVPGDGEGSLTPQENTLDHLHARGGFLGQRELLSRLICHAGETARRGGDAKMELGSDGSGRNPVLTFQIPPAEVRDNCKAAAGNVARAAPGREGKQRKRAGKDLAPVQILMSESGSVRSTRVPIASGFGCRN